MKGSEFMRNFREFGDSYTKCAPVAIASIADLNETASRIGSDLTSSGELLKSMLANPPVALADLLPFAEAEWSSAASGAHMSQQTIKTHLETVQFVFHLLKWQFDIARLLSREPDKQDWSLTIASVGMIATILASFVTNATVQVAGYATGLASLIDTIKALQNRDKAYEDRKHQEQLDEVATRFFKLAKGGVECLRQLSVDGHELAESRRKMQEETGIPAWRAKWEEKLV